MGSSTDTSVASDTDNELPKGISHVITNFRLKRFVWHIIQSAPAALLEMSMWLMILAGIAHCYGMVIQLPHVPVILGLNLSSMVACGICWGFSWPAKPFPGYSKLVLATNLAVSAFTLGVFCFTRAPHCHPILCFVAVAAHVAASIPVQQASQVPEYDPSKLQLKVIKTSLWYDGLIYTCLLLIIRTWASPGVHKMPSNETVEALARFQNAECGKPISQDQQCVKDLNECVEVLNKARKVYNQSAIPLLQFDLNDQLNLTDQLVGRQAAKDPVAHVTDELNQHIQKLFDPSAPSATIVEAYSILRENTQCVAALKQSKNGVNQPDRNKQCDNDADDFLNGFDEFVTDFNQCTDSRWFSIALTGSLLVYHLPYIGQQVFIPESQAQLSNLWAEYGEKYFKNRFLIIRAIVDWNLTRYPLSFIGAFFLCVRILCGWAADKQSIVAAILCMVLMFVTASTFHEVPKPATANPDPEGTELVPIPNADVSKSITSLEAPLEESSTNSSAPTAPSLGALTPGSEDPVQSSMASTESSAPSHSQGNLMNHLEGSSTQSPAPATVPELSSSGNASQSGISSVQHTPSSSTRGFPKSGSSNP